MARSTSTARSDLTTERDSWLNKTLHRAFPVEP
jgi:hypothetical protein